MEQAANQHHYSTILRYNIILHELTVQCDSGFNILKSLKMIRIASHKLKKSYSYLTS